MLRSRAYCKFKLTAPISTLRERKRATILPTSKTSTAPTTFGIYAKTLCTSRRRPFRSDSSHADQNPRDNNQCAIACATSSVGLCNGDHSANEGKPQRASR